MLRASAIAAVAATASAAVPADLVTNLPGFGTPLSSLYSGYLSAGTGKHAHYVYSASLNNPKTDPVVVWFNGGPGCSSLEGAFSESGLYHIQEFTNPPTLAVNPFSWNNVTNSLFIEAPTGVGYSYCDTADGCSHTDTSTAQDNLATLISFFQAYPELANNGFWIAGESYAGIYIPSLAYAIYQYSLTKPTTPINLKGILVGNGCIGNAAGHCGDDPTGLNDYHDIQQWKGHGLVSETLYDSILKECVWNNESNQCENDLQAAANAIGNLDVYYLYNTCDDPAAMRRRAPYAKNSLLARVEKIRQNRLDAKRSAGKPLRTDPNCFSTGATLETWANQDAVKTALHVAPAIDWSLCSNNNTFGYNSDIADERTTIYPTLTKQAGYKVLIFNGEADLCVPYTDNEWWTRTMNYSVLSAWQPWNVNGNPDQYVGGYVIQYANNFTFATVRGAGHMVPETRPEAALAMFKTHLGIATPEERAW